MAGRAKTILIYGESGDTKTSQCIDVAKYVWKKFGKRTRLISSDGGGWAPVEDEGLIRKASNPEGIVEAWDATNRDLYLAEWRYLSKGYWPIIKKEGGELVRTFAPPNDPSLVKRGPIGAYFIEGLTSLSSGFIGHISKQDNTNNSTKVMYSAPGYDEGGEHFGATDQGHVGMVQNELWNIVNQFGTLDVELMVWTALVGACTEKSLRKIGVTYSEMNPTFGPKLAGNAKTAEAPSWFSDCLHIQGKTFESSEEVIGKDIVSKTDKEVWLWFRKHVDGESGNKFLAKCSTAPSIIEEMYRRFPGGYVPMRLGEGIGKYLEMIDEIKEEKTTKGKG